MPRPLIQGPGLLDWKNSLCRFLSQKSEVSDRPNPAGLKAMRLRGATRPARPRFHSCLRRAGSPAAAAGFRGSETGAAHLIGPSVVEA